MPIVGNAVFHSLMPLYIVVWTLEVIDLSSTYFIYGISKAKSSKSNLNSLGPEIVQWLPSMRYINLTLFMA